MRGFFIFIHSDTEYPYNLTPSPTLVTPGIGSKISLSRSFYEQFNEWPYTYSECRVDGQNELIGPPLNDPSLFEQVIATNYSYSRSICILFCAQLKTTRACGCNNYVIPNPVKGYDLCIRPAQVKCAHGFFYFRFLKGDFIKENCLAKCPLECTRNQLTTLLSYYKFPTVLQAKEFSANIMNETNSSNDFQKIENNLVRVSFYYDTFSYTQVEEKAAMSFENLIGALGGHLGLFLGMSLLSFVELIDIAIIRIQLSFQLKQQTPSRKQTSGDSPGTNNQDSEQTHDNLFSMPSAHN